MFDKMVKMKNKKGFTLVEMLVVIAVIAILSSLVIPMFSSSTTKANAATNAANLRSVQGVVATMLVSGEVKHETSETTDALISATQETIALLEQGLPWTESLVAAEQFVLATLQRTKKGLNTYYAENGVLNIDGVTITAPTAKPIKVGELTLRKGTEMTVTIAEDDIIVTYAGISIDVMAAIAEQGDEATLDMTATSHLFTDSNGDGICDMCNGTYKHSETDKILDSAENALSGAHSCSDTTGDCICDDPNCGMKIPCVDSNLDYNCDNCGAVQAHGHYDDNADGVCDVNNCDKSADHSCKDDDWNYVCDADLCKLPIKHNFYDSTGCTGDSDVNCDLCGQPEENTAYHN